MRWRSRVSSCLHSQRSRVTPDLRHHQHKNRLVRFGPHTEDAIPRLGADVSEEDRLRGSDRPRLREAGAMNASMR